MFAQITRITGTLVLGVSLVAAGSFVVAAESAQPKAGTPVAYPKNPKGLKAPVKQPKGVDVASGYFPQVSCDPRTQKGVAKFRNLVLKTYRVGSNGGTGRNCSYGGDSEHKEGRAFDWMVNVKKPKEKAAAANFLAWVTANRGIKARRLGIMYIIYNKKIWSVYRMSAGWRKYTGAASHTDHVHTSFSWAGARGNTSFWKGKVGRVDYGRCGYFRGQPAQLRSSPRTTRCWATAKSVKLSKYPTLKYGSTNAKVKVAQGRLGARRTGRFDASTWSKVKRYQAARDLPTTGVLDHATWSALVRSKMKYNAGKGQTPSSAAAYGRKHYAKKTLKRYSRGKAVLFLQVALNMPRTQRNGVYGSKTVAAVKSAQSSKGQRRTGTASKSLWRILPRR